MIMSKIKIVGIGYDGAEYLKEFMRTTSFSVETMAIVTNIAKDIGATSITVACIPYTFEGPRRRKNSLDSLIKLNSAADYVFAIESDYFIHSAEPKTPLSEAFKIVSDSVAENVNKILICHHQLRIKDICN